MQLTKAKEEAECSTTHGRADGAKGAWHWDLVVSHSRCQLLLVLETFLIFQVCQ